LTLEQKFLDNYWPGADYVDYVGQDYYPDSKANITHYTAITAPFYDRFAHKYNKPMLQGETGLHYNGPMHDKLVWLSSIINSKKTRFPLLQGVTLFNFISNYEPYNKWVCNGILGAR
jgi:beta-mannanase